MPAGFVWPTRKVARLARRIKKGVHLTISMAWPDPVRSGSPPGRMYPQFVRYMFLCRARRVDPETRSAFLARDPRADRPRRQLCPPNAPSIISKKPIHLHRLGAQARYTRPHRLHCRDRRWMWFAARIAYVPLYLFGIPWLRSACWAVSAISITLMQVRFLS